MQNDNLKELWEIQANDSAKFNPKDIIIMDKASINY